MSVLRHRSPSKSCMRFLVDFVAEAPRHDPLSNAKRIVSRIMQRAEVTRVVAGFAPVLDRRPRFDRLAHLLTPFGRSRAVAAAGRVWAPRARGIALLLPNGVTRSSRRVGRHATREQDIAGQKLPAPVKAAPRYSHERLGRPLARLDRYAARSPGAAGIGIESELLRF